MCTCSPPCRRRRPRRAFTLVELLSVIGVIAFLIAMLFPTLATAREHANRTKCLSNLRQLAMAFLMYTNDNDGRFPRPAQHRVERPEDWVHYQPGRNPQDGAVARYVSRTFDANHYRCPSDDVTAHKTFQIPFEPPVRYEFSYSVNERIFRLWPHTTLRITQIRSPSEKILLIDESAETIDDGCWAWQPAQGAGMNVMSNRHDRKRENTSDPDDGRGNVAFADGHAEYIARDASFEPRHYDPLVR